jgi:hypothetical protein
MFTESLLETGLSGASGSGPPYVLTLLPGRSNECLDQDLDAINHVLNDLLNRGLPYEPYGRRFNELQGDAEIFRGLYPRPFPGDKDELVSNTLDQAQWETIERLKNGLNTLRSDLARASTLYDELKAFVDTPSLLDQRANRNSLLQGFLGVTRPTRSHIVALSSPVADISPRRAIVENAMRALRAGRLDDAQMGLNKVNEMLSLNRLRALFTGLQFTKADPIPSPSGS